MATKSHAKAPAKRKHVGRPARAGKITSEIRTLAAEVKDLRSLRAKYDQLLRDHHGLVGALRELSNELAGSARAAWDDYRGKGSGPARQRVRRSSAHVDEMTVKLAGVLPAAWTSKEDICKAAGLDPVAANSAFRRLVLGYRRNGKKVASVLESNGSRGTKGRYRKR
jgi:hypothetical protein